jgi:DNA-binding transcriptional LysR family regulator
MSTHEASLSRAGISVIARQHYDANSATAFALVSSGYGWSLLPTTARAALPPTLRYLALTDVAIPLEIQLIVRTDDRSTRCRVFRRIVQDLVGAP